jgi:hypothetical protein
MASNILLEIIRISKAMNAKRRIGCVKQLITARVGYWR